MSAESRPYCIVNRNAWKALGLFIFAGLGLFVPILIRLFAFSRQEGAQHYSHFVLIPFIAGYFFFLQRAEIRKAAADRSGGRSSTGAVYAPRTRSGMVGILAIVLSGALYLLGKSHLFDLSLNDYLAVMTASLVLYIVGSFIWIFGTGTFHAARFPLLFLVFLIPVPDFLLGRIVVALQVASTTVVDWLFRLSGMVYFRDGFQFSLPGLAIEVAKECSGIRSSLSLFIVSILMGHMLLRTTWGKTALALVVFPITVFKNGVRIVLLSYLAIHWDPGVMHGSLHRTGGIPFFVVAMTLLGMVFLVIRSLEGIRPRGPAPGE